MGGDLFSIAKKVFNFIVHYNCGYDNYINIETIRELQKEYLIELNILAKEYQYLFNTDKNHKELRKITESIQTIIENSKKLKQFERNLTNE